MSVINAADRFSKRFRRNCWEILHQVPAPVAVAVLTAVRNQSEEPLNGLPPEWRERAVKAFRESMGEA
jgi:hypothetical protein